MGVFRVPSVGAVVSRGCSCLNCTNQFEGTCHSVGAVETTAPPWLEN